MRIIDKRLLASFGARRVCNWCGRCFGTGYICAHHIISRGAGGSDLPENLLAVDFECHRYIEGHASKRAQFEILAPRLMTTAAKLDEFLRAVQRLDKSATAEDVQRLRLEILGRAA